MTRLLLAAWRPMDITGEFTLSTRRGLRSMSALRQVTSCSPASLRRVQRVTMHAPCCMADARYHPSRIRSLDSRVSVWPRPIEGTRSVCYWPRRRLISGITSHGVHFLNSLTIRRRL